MKPVAMAHVFRQLVLDMENRDEYGAAKRSRESDRDSRRVVARPGSTIVRDSLKGFGK
jgi:hypothetical protein